MTKEYLNSSFADKEKVGTKKREEWVDRVKFLGILAIYIGHFGETAGWLYEFVFTYHVPLFFFVAGFFAGNNSECTVRELVKKKIKALIIPYFFLGILNIGFYVLVGNPGIDRFLSMFKSFCGIRSNMDYFGSMWFIPCLFFVEIIYEVLYKACSNKIFIAFVGVLMFGAYILLQLPAHIFLSVDCVLIYFLYFALGSFLFPYIKNFKPENLTLFREGLYITFVLASIGCAVLVYFQKEIYITGWMWSFNYKPIRVVLLYGWDILMALNMIFINILLARSLDIVFLSKLGQETLIFCGTESISKDAIKSIAAMTFGGEGELQIPFQVVAFSFICLIVSHFTIVDFLKRYVPALVGQRR